MFSITIGKNDAGQRLDKFLMKSLSLPDALMYRFIRQKKIKVNRKRAEISYKLIEGDELQLFIPDEFDPAGKEHKEVYLNTHIDTVYEDNNIILINKPCGLIVHDDIKEEDCLSRRLVGYLIEKGEYSPKEHSFSPALCNRIDRNTMGIVIAAKNAEAQREMYEIIREREIVKKYICVVHGKPPKKEDILEGMLFKDEKTNKVKIYTSYKAPKGSKTVKTGYKLLSYNKEKDLSLLEVELYTGRTHQIRAHMAYIGCPLYGDGKYGINKKDREEGYKFQALCSYYLEFKLKNKYNTLAYLNGRTFKIDPENVYFVRDFYN